MPLSRSWTIGEQIGSAVTDPLEGARSGDPESFERLYREHVGRVFALCLRLSGEGGRAEELTQDVFVRAWQTLGTFRGESAFSSWLHRLTVNVALTAFRGEGRRERRVRPVAALPDVAGREGAGDHDIDLERAIAALPPGARAVFVMYDVEGYQHDEIARELGIAVGTSKAHLFRARRLLREALER
ncbi:MAG: RNA polymerase sigma factor [Gemmatimonadaceae bacterium]